MKNRSRELQNPLSLAAEELHLEFHGGCSNGLTQVTRHNKGSTNSRNGTDRTKFTHYFTERTGQMNAEFRRMRQVCCHVFMEVLPQLVMAVLGLGYYWIFISDG